MRRVVSAIAVGAVLALPSPAFALGGESNSFEGACTFDEGAILYPDGGLKDKARRLLVVIRAEGTCSGELSGKPVQGLPFEFHARGRDRFSCNPGDSIDHLPGVLDFKGRGNNIGGFVNATTTGVVVNAGFEFEGRDRGALTGNLSAMPPPDAAIRCMEEGLKRVPFTAQAAGNIRG